MHVHINTIKFKPSSRLNKFNNLEFYCIQLTSIESILNFNQTPSHLSSQSMQVTNRHTKSHNKHGSTSNFIKNPFISLLKLKIKDPITCIRIWKTKSEDNTQNEDWNIPQIVWFRSCWILGSARTKSDGAWSRL